MMNYSQMPFARKEGLVIQEIADEVLVYDLETNKAHCLNRTAAFVWKSCDGKYTIEEVSKLLAKDEGKRVEEDIIRLAISQLSEKKLLETKSPIGFSELQNRRETIKKIGLAAAIALPGITSLVAPTAASAGTTCTQTCTCTLAAACNNPGGTCICVGNGTSANSCTSPCNGGCGGCAVNDTQTSCTGACQP